ncbi:hypothetical protein V8C86DRAFT_1049628 [Haematococcus lacustris]
MHADVKGQFVLIPCHIPWLPLAIAELLLSEMKTSGKAKRVGVRITGDLGLAPGWIPWGPYSGLIVDLCKRLGVEVFAAYATACRRVGEALRRLGGRRLPVRRLASLPHPATCGYRQERRQAGGQRRRRLPAIWLPEKDLGRICSRGSRGHIEWSLHHHSCSWFCQVPALICSLVRCILLCLLWLHGVRCHVTDTAQTSTQGLAHGCDSSRAVHQ